MKFIDFFAGIGGFRHGMELAGHECIGACEWDRYAAASYTSMHLITEEQRKYLATLDLKKRQKEILKDEYRNGEWYSNDIRNVDAGSVPKAGCWCFGAPCQDFSIAGKRAGLNGSRSSLIREIFRILGEIREEDRPEWIIYENVKGMLSSNRGFDFLEILLAMDELGYDIEWQIFNSKYWGVPQNRERVYTIGHFRRCGTGKILPITGKNGENSISVIANEKFGYEQSGRIYGVEGISPTLNGNAGGNHEPKVGLPCFIDMNYGAGIRQTESARSIQARYYKGVCNRNGKTSGVMIPINEDILLSGKNYNQRSIVHPAVGISRTLISSGHSGNEPKVAIPVLTPDMIKKNQNGRRFKEDGEPVFTVTGQDRHGVALKVREAAKQGCGIWYEKYQCYIAIRKLTPKECFRLQGWDDLYFERASFVNSNSQLYKQAGNGVTVNVVYAIGKAIAELEKKPKLH